MFELSVTPFNVDLLRLKDYVDQFASLLQHLGRKVDNVRSSGILRHQSTVMFSDIPSTVVMLLGRSRSFSRCSQGCYVLYLGRRRPFFAYGSPQKKVQS